MKVAPQLTAAIKQNMQKVNEKQIKYKKPYHSFDISRKTFSMNRFER